MERLTTNKDVSEMGMYELAHNSCYYKDGKVRYRDFESDIDARELTRQILVKFADGDDAFVDDEDFDEEILELLQYGTETIEGLIALFYRNMWDMADLRERLKEYEDLEQQGLMLRLPCKVGTLVYQAYSIGGISGVDEHRLKLEDISEFGETVFLTQAESEQKLKEMEEC